MKNAKQILSIAPKKGITRREGMMLTVLGSALLMAGCGGGGGGSPTASVQAGGTGSSASGAITGFGSIIVGGVRFDDSAASILDDDGAGLKSGDLKLGMVVRIKGGKKTDDGTSIRANAESIEVHSELQGPVDSVTPTSIVVLGQTVKISATTFFEDGLTAATLVAGTIVEVHGFVDPATNTLTATRIERKANAKVFKLQGTVSALNPATFKLGTLTISYRPEVVPSSLTLANGSVVRVRLETTPVNGTWTARKVQKFEIEQEDRNEAEVEGIVTTFESSTRFSVNGLLVNASAAVVPAGVKLGARVEVEGSVVSGVLIAKKVELEDERDDVKFELHGTPSLLNTTAKTFVLRGMTVNYGSATFYNGATATSLSDVRIKLEVKGMRSDANVIVATRISLDR